MNDNSQDSTAEGKGAERLERERGGSLAPDPAVPASGQTTDRRHAGASTPHPLAGSVVRHSSGLPGDPATETEDGRLLPEERLIPGSRPPRPR